MTKDTTFQICRLCGYIREVHKGIACPACGAPPTAFVPYQHKASSTRLKYLEFDLHPVTIHFTISYTISLAVLFVLSLITPDLFGIPIRDSGLLKFFVLFLPIFVLAGGLTGLLDGKMRYRKLRTRFLTIKMTLATILLVVSLITLAAHLASNEGTNTTFVALETLTIISSAILAAVLGWFGSKLTCALVPRGTEKS